MFDLQSMALNMLQNNPRVTGNPRAQEMINIIKSGDNVKGQQLANNLCQTYGVDPKDAYGKAQRFFGF